MTAILPHVGCTSFLDSSTFCTYQYTTKIDSATRRCLHTPLFRSLDSFLISLCTYPPTFSTYLPTYPSRGRFHAPHPTKPAPVVISQSLIHLIIATHLIIAPTQSPSDHVSLQAKGPTDQREAQGEYVRSFVLVGLFCTKCLPSFACLLRYRCVRVRT